jgi:hypothetical protein
MGRSPNVKEGSVVTRPFYRGWRLVAFCFRAFAGKRNVSRKAKKRKTEDAVACLLLDFHF